MQNTRCAIVLRPHRPRLLARRAAAKLCAPARQAAGLEALLEKLVVGILELFLELHHLQRLPAHRAAAPQGAMDAGMHVPGLDRAHQEKREEGRGVEEERRSERREKEERGASGAEE